MYDTDQKNAQVQSLLNLTEADIQSNRQRQVSDTQRERIYAQGGFVWRGLALLFLLPAFVPFVLLFVLSGMFQLLAGLLLLSWTIGFGRAALSLRRRRLETLEDLVANRVEKAEGDAWCLERSKNEHYIGVDEREFIVPKELFELVEEGDPLAIYYLGTSQKLLSIEFVPYPFIEENMTI